MSTTRQPLNIFGEAYSSRFWQRHTLVEGPTPKGVVYGPRQAATGKPAKPLPALNVAEAATMREHLLVHIETDKIKKNPGALLVASSNLSRFNRTTGAQNPISQTLLLQSPRGAKAASHLTRTLEKIAAKDATSAKHHLALAHLTDEDLRHEGDPDVVRDKVMDLFEGDLARIKTKYGNMETWSQSAIAFGEYAQERTAGSSPFSALELKDMRALRSQLQRTAQVAKLELAEFDGMYRRVAASVMLFGKVTSKATKLSNHYPLVVPNLISGGTFIVHHEAQLNLFADIFEEVLGGIEDVRLESVSPRLAELTEAQALLGRALRGRSGSPPPIKL